MSFPAHLNYGFAKAWGVVVLGGDVPIRVGVISETSRWVLSEVRRVIGSPITVETLDQKSFDHALSQTYASRGLVSSVDAVTQQNDLYALVDDIPQTEDLLDSADDAPVIKLINGMIQEAIRLRASDVHVEPNEKRLVIRFRIDGTLREMLSLSVKLSPVLASRIKVMARLDIAKKRIPQDGRFSLNLGARAIDVRVSTLPSRFGERVVMRLLNKEQALLSVSELGMTPKMSARFNKALGAPNGIILVSGPTGSGKTTTLYAGLTTLNDATRNIMTVEDPIEYALDGIGQTQVNNKIGMSFAAGLRAILRQDPDVVMVGEIRDPETAEIAVQASLTGHLVLSTVHTNSAIAAITRLRDMGVEKFLLASTITAIVAQRLVRKLCEECKVPYTPDTLEVKLLGLKKSGQIFYRPTGCEACNNIGYHGRIGLYEMVVMDDDLRAMIHDGAPEQDMEHYAFCASDTLLKSGARHVQCGVANAHDVLRVCRPSENV